VRADTWLDAPTDAAGGLVEEWTVEGTVVTIGIEPVA